MPSEPPGGAYDAGPLRSEPGALLEDVAVAVFGFDGDGRLSVWGPGARDLFGYDVREVLSRPASLLFPEPLPSLPGPAGDRLAATALTHGYWRIRTPARHRDGTVFDCGVRVFPLSRSTDEILVLALASRGDELDRVKTNLVFLDALFRTCPIGLVRLDEHLRYVHLNQALADMDGASVAEHLGRGVGEFMLTPDGGGFERLLRGVADSGRPVVGALMGLRTPGRPDRDQVRSVSFFPLSQAGGTRPGLGGLLVDVTDREQAIVEATANRQRLALLNRAAERIGTTLDVRVTAGELVDSVVPDFCDGAVVDVVEWLDESQPFTPELPLYTRRIAAGTTLPEPAVELIEGLERVSWPPGSPVHETLRTGRPVSFDVDEDFVTRTVVHQQRARLLVDSGLACIVIAPLIARGTAQGLAMFGRSAQRPAFTGQDLDLAGELASRAALCLDNARLYSRVEEIALTLQRALLPVTVAHSPHLEIAHRYFPGSRATEVGGDWYDVTGVPGDRVALVVGDVMGHGVPAAAAMGRLRITAKALARTGMEPAEVLTELDACARESGIDLATCLYIVHDPATGRARVASAGHLPALVRRPDGSVDTVDEVLGVPLGVGGVPFRTTGIELPDGSTLALYTDGLVESRDHDIDVGLDALRAALARADADSLEEAADGIVAGLLPEGPTDDTVLVLARVRTTPRPGDGGGRPGPGREG
ncbi:SpoIIE family protein phosphatase [Streptomyces bambusae]|uniref:SpoIIE family protein phosphatase n=1 Tax=Streptomyces bambusae TaxID=1550616 RepID=UPI0027DECB69|nr:SpoIIE family protein phosphatase [Streptomyces bambusae]